MIKTHSRTLSDGLSNIFRVARTSLMDQDINKLSVLSTELTQLRENLTDHMILLSNLTDECKYRMSELIDETKFQVADVTNKFIFKGPNQTLNWADMSDIEDRRKSLIEKTDEVISHIQNDEYVPNKEIQYINKIPITTTRFPIVSNLEMLKPAIQWFIGDDKHNAGLYMCLSDGCYIEVPFPDIIDGTKNTNRTSSIKCRHQSHVKCMTNRETLANKYNSIIRQCNFAHLGDKYVKIGTSFRCPELPSFGSHKSLVDDMEIISDTDIRMVLMYAMSDILLSNIWWQHKNKKDDVLHDLDICA